MLTTPILSTITNILNNTVWKSVTKSIEEALSRATTDGSPTPHWLGRAGTRVRTSLKEIEVQTSTYGRMLCKVYGTAKVSGNIIWAQPIRRTKHKAAHVKHNSQSVKHTTGYYATLAIAICSGPMHRLSRMWANDKPLDLAAVKHRLYKGTEDQEPDPLISSTERPAPAYRGIAYIVIEDLPLQDYNGTVPSFTFEVTAYPEGFLRDHVVQKIYCIHTVGGGEFSYDTEIQKITQSGSTGTQDIVYGTAVKINGESGYARPNALLALDAMQSTLTNVQWVAVTVYWFTDGPNIKQCKVRPATMYGHGTRTIPDTWKVGNFTATNAYKFGQEDGRHTLKRTANDASLVRYIRELKSRGYKVLLLPKLIVNFEEGTQLVCENSRDIGQFFDRQYRPFIEHYCLLTGGIIDAFVIGSGFTSLTRITDGTESFPAVKELVRLAELAKRTLGNSVVVTYAANWDEYHSYDGAYNMDELWASEYVDVIGINAYFPLANTPNPMHRFSIQSVAQSWHSGEGHDHPDENFPPRQSEIYHENFGPAWNIHQWWNRDHINRHSGAKTAWQPKSKKVWFIEYGFRSVTDCTHQQLSPEQYASVAGSMATNSVDCLAQKTAIEGTLDAWHSSEMVERMFLYAWNLESYVKMEPYSYQNWQTGHWINGKIDSVTLSAILQSILGEVGLRSTTPKEADESVPGYSVHNYTSAEAVTRELATIYCLNMREEEGKLIFSGTDPKSILHVPGEDIIPDSYHATYTLKASCGTQALLYISRRFGHQPRLRNPPACRADGVKSSILQTSLVLDELQAEAIVDDLQYLITNQNCFYRISLPIKYAYLNVGDVISVELEHMQPTIKIVNVRIAGLLVHLGGFIYTPMHLRQKGPSCILAPMGTITS